jgi:uncharacterized membrane protein
VKAVLVVIALAGVAAADTGGSMGGGDWSSGPSLGHGSPSSNDTPSYEPPTFGTTNIPVYEPPHPTYTPVYVPHGATDGSGVVHPIPQDLTLPDLDDGPDWTFRLFFIAVAGFIGYTWMKVLFFADRPVVADAFTALLHRHDNDADVSVLRVALDGRVRRALQAALARIAARTDTSTQEGRVQMLREVTRLVRQMRDAWVYGGAVNEPMRGMADAKRAFDHHVDDARTRFREETIRNEDGARTATAASAYTPRSDEGEGLILVTFVIAARRDLYTVKKIDTGDDLRAALEAAFYLDEQNLVAVEIVWQPSEETDRLSSVELEAKYPRPALVPIKGALVGKAFCTFCGGPYPAELVSCPHCGAPAHEEAA